MFNINGKNALVTGGASGIGLRYVKQLLDHNAAKVAIFDSNEVVGLKETEALNKTFGQGRAIFLKVDVTNAKLLEESFQKVVNEFKRLDILINNAGILNDNKWELQFNINITAMFRGCLLGFKYMGKDEGGQGGVIVNVASIAGLAPFSSLPGYVATKHAVVGATVSFGSEEHFDRTGVKVMAICPGITNTPLISDTQKESRTLNEAYDKILSNVLQKFQAQKPESVAEAMMKIIENGTTGSVWVAEDDLPPYEIEIPNWLDRRKPYISA